MHGGTDSRGYTILETMIFLAVSGFMFVVAASFVSGKQSKSEFRQGMNELNTQIQQVINDVSNGYYPSNNNFSCSAYPTSPPEPQFGPVAAGTQQGNNQGCVFTGKVIQFAVKPNSSAPPDNTKYNIYTLAGRQYVAGSNNSQTVTTFTETHGVVAQKPGIFDTTDFKTLQWGLQVSSMYSYNAATPMTKKSYGAIGFLSSLSGSANSTNGTQSVLTTAGGTFGMTESDSITGIATDYPLLDGYFASNPRPVTVLCLTNDNGQYGSLTIGGSDSAIVQRLTTTVQIFSDHSSWMGAGCTP